MTSKSRKTPARCYICKTVATGTRPGEYQSESCIATGCGTLFELAREQCPARGALTCTQLFFDFETAINHCAALHSDFCHHCHQPFVDLADHRRCEHPSIRMEILPNLYEDIVYERCPASAAWVWSDFQEWRGKQPQPPQPLHSGNPAQVPLAGPGANHNHQVYETSAYKDSPDSKTSGTPLPPSVEQAYYRKCIALKRRLNEIEANNEAAHIRKARLERGIMKMRLERAFLMERLAERMTATVDESDRSTSPPPTVGAPTQPGPPYTNATPDSAPDHLRQPQEKPTRSKRANNSINRQKTPPLESTGSAPSHHSPTSNTQQASHLPPMSQMAPSAHSTPDPQRLGSASGSGGGTGGLFSFSTNARPELAASPLAHSNGTPATPFSGSQHQPLRPLSRHGMPPMQQPQFIDNNGYDGVSRPRSSSRNGAAAENGSADHGNGSERRAYAPSAGATGETLSAGPEIKTDANGERRLQQDTEMADAPPPPQGAENEQAGPPGFGGGFTAVNR